MSLRMTFAALGLFLWSVMPAAGHAASAGLVIDTSQRTVNIRSGFTGINLLVFGAILHPGGRIPDEAPDIAVVVEGPLNSIAVREKEKLAGVIWVNSERNDFRSVPSFYGIASTRPLDELIDRKTADIYQLGLNHIYFSPTGRLETEKIHRFQDGLVDLRQRGGQFVERDGGVEITQNVLYRTRIPMPADVPVGVYRASAYLIQDGRVLSVEETEVQVEKQGFERLMTVFAQDYSLLYGLCAVLISLLLGWLAGTFLRRD